jgi:hypothetical protein
LQRAQHHRAYQVASELRDNAAILHRLYLLRRRSGGGVEAFAARHFTGKQRFNIRQATRERFDPANADAWLVNPSTMKAIRHQRGGHGEVASAAAHLEKPEMSVIRKKRDAAFHHQLVGGD